MTDKAEPRRLRWSVPRADESTNRWLDEQYDISRSLQLLIRESIQRDGYIDVVNRPVEQLPRRGRPPGDAIEQSRPPQGEQDPGRSEAHEGQERGDDRRDESDSQHESRESRDEAAVPAAASEPVRRVEVARMAEPPAAPPAPKSRPIPAEEPSVPSGLDAFLTR
ncbi:MULTISPECIES: hypothetical protein [Paenarthrobacter]|uniref:Uncharacterized protein n=1 Tax=Paenarthrobacter ureafaciens TaxID=37931 RepID=A0AAX3EDN5_PAEUR|nr:MULTISPECIES: hypothetical protein [Paenarthrobacter]NKR13278.1 hypothetical protein [Arthrobacter sp. M5]NKR14872.1 hypothetical protein [Arthrobacter sp. M6]OEH62423.1 hypothetical protein A5N13_01840 [Arthrobacter sp. D4]OEH62994.1 hypothetical protein A5N17_10080 [Arthrobacter sp. D2]MDO5865173.1 hypothetical protein [Paenarthrobacter sp. SD-2]